jgi:hypothetical protein
MLKAFIKDLNELPEPLREHYVASDGGYVLDVDKKEYSDKINEFRMNNINLTNQLQEFGNITPESYNQLKTEYEKLKANPPEGGGDADIERIKTEYEQRLEQANVGKTEAETRAQTYQDALNGHIVDNVVAQAISNVGKIHKGALPDVLRRAREVWRVNENGVPVAMNGETVVYGADGKLPLTVEEYAQNLMQDAPYYFEGNSGGGAGGSGAGSGGSGGSGPATITREQFQNNPSVDLISKVAKGEVVVEN